MKNIDPFFNKVSNYIINGLLIIAIVFLIYKYLLPYWAGDYKMKIDYYHQTK